MKVNHNQEHIIRQKFSKWSRETQFSVSRWQREGDGKINRVIYYTVTFLGTWPICFSSKSFDGSKNINNQNYKPCSKRKWASLAQGGF